MHMRTYARDRIQTAAARPSEGAEHLYPSARGPWEDDHRRRLARLQRHHLSTHVGPDPVRPLSQSPTSAVRLCSVALGAMCTCAHACRVRLCAWDIAKLAFVLICSKRPAWCNRATCIDKATVGFVWHHKPPLTTAPFVRHFFSTHSRSVLASHSHVP
jgi:hypothetical protein